MVYVYYIIRNGSIKIIVWNNYLRELMVDSCISCSMFSFNLQILIPDKKPINRFVSKSISVSK